MEYNPLSKETQKIVETFLEEQEITDYTIHTTLATAPGENFAGFINRIKINGKNNQNSNVQLVIIAKTAPNNENVRLLFPVKTMYEKEVYCYTKLFPELNKLQNEYNICNPLLFPALYKASLQFPNEVLLLEDMINLDYKKVDFLKTLDYDHTLFVIKQYGRLHALSFALKLLKPDVFENLKRNTIDRIFQAIRSNEAGEKYYKMRTDLVLSCIDKAKNTRAYDLFLKFSEKMFDVAKQLVDAENAGDYAVIGHGDSWTSNYLFKYNESNQISNMCMLDWQMARYGSPALDLSQFLFCCTSHEIRKEHYSDLISEYYQSFSELFSEFKIKAHEVFPFPVLEIHLKKFSAYGLFVAVTILSLTLLQSENIPTLQNSKSENDMYKMPIYNTAENNTTFKSRMGSIVIDFANLGFEV